MLNRKAIFYGEVEIIPGVICDGYVLNNGVSVMSERGTANLLDMDHSTLRDVVGNWPPKSLKAFCNSVLNVVGNLSNKTLESTVKKNLSVANNLVEVTAPKSHHKGRKIVVYTSEVIENLIRTYALAFANEHLRKNQRHIGKRCVILQSSLLRTALDVAIKESCGFTPNFQKTAQKHYTNTVELIQKFGFKCSVENNIAIKKDIIDFLKVPHSTLNSFLYKHSHEIKPLKLSFETIRSIGSKAKRMNGYHLKDVAKIAVGMDTEVGLKLKRKMFGEFGDFAKVHAKDEIHWREILSKVFAGFDLRYSYCIEKSRYIVDFFVADLLLCLECNGVSHKYYNAQEEKKRENIITEKYALVRFQPDTGLESLFNAILHTKPGKVIRLKSEYDCQKILLNQSNN